MVALRYYLVLYCCVVCECFLWNFCGIFVAVFRLQQREANKAGQHLSYTVRKEQTKPRVKNGRIGERHLCCCGPGAYRPYTLRIPRCLLHADTGQTALTRFWLRLLVYASPVVCVVACGCIYCLYCVVQVWNQPVRVSHENIRRAADMNVWPVPYQPLTIQVRSEEPNKD